MSEFLDPVIKKMRERFRLAESAEVENRIKGLEALKFRSGGKHQWDSAIYDSRTTEKRPTESHNQIPQFVHKLTNNMRMNMPQVKIVPKEDADKELAEVYEDICRDIQSSSEAEVAYDTATDMQVTIGWGFWRILTEYEDEEDESEDQVIKIKRIANPFMVYDDPYAMEQDRSDRRFAFIISDRPVDDHNEEYDVKYDTSDLQSIGDSMPDWASPENKTIREVEYFEVTDEKKGKTGEKERIRRKVTWRKCTANKVLETREWAGKYIPLVFVSGEELNIDGKKELSGIVEGLIPAQRQYNYWTNAATEAVALAPKSPFIGYVDQFKGLEHIWDSANSKAYPFLPVNLVSEGAQVLPLPQRQSPGTDISSFIALLQGAQQNMYSVSGIYPAALGQQSNETSGKAINARKVEGDLSNFHFPDNNARAIRFTGRILVDLIPKIIDTPRTLMRRKLDGKTEPVRVNESFQDKRGETRKFDLSKGKFDVAVTTGPSYTTKREQALDSMIQISQANPAIWQIAPDLMVREMDWPGSEKLAKRFEKILPPNMLEDEQPAQIPPQVQQQMQQAQQMIDALSEQLHAVQDQLESKQADEQAKAAEIQVKQQDLALKEKSEQGKQSLEREKIQLDREKMDLERDKMEYEAQRQQNEQVNDGEDYETEGDDMMNKPQPMSEDEILRQAQDIAQRRQQEEQQMMMQQQMMEEQSARSDALLQSIMQIAQLLENVAVSIKAPKQVVRGEDGMIQGIVTAGADDGQR